MRILSFITTFLSPDEKQKKETARKHMRENFLNDHAEQPKMDDFLETKKQQSMLDKQGVTDFKGSSYHGLGNVDREKRNSNMNQTNY